MNTKHTITLQFDDPEDLQRFLSFMKRAKESEGTPSPLWCGLGASAVKRSKIVGESYLLEALKAMLSIHGPVATVHESVNALNQARAAIARAEGKE